jgi:fused signal recognition particle receptor
MFGIKKDRSKHQPDKPRRMARLRERLSRTRGRLTSGLASLVKGRKRIDDQLLDEIEDRLLAADMGVEATMRVIDDLRARVGRRQLGDPKALFEALREDMYTLLEPCSRPLRIPDRVRPFAILVVGVNGVGKTTTIGKLARRLQDQGLAVMLAAGDTFRAAAVEQLQHWGEAHGIPVVAQSRQADTAAVVYDAFEAARSRGADVLIADTAGRLHTKHNLMEEIKKVQRVLKKIDPAAPHEVLLVLDAGTGQNALSQAEQFHSALGLTGIALTKLDGTAKGGIIFAVADKLGVPIRFIGVGEGAEDLRELDAAEFVDALLEMDGDQ